jgi:hypothetical protein
VQLDERVLGLLAQPANERAQDPQPKHVQLVSVRNAPRLELRAARQVKIVEEPAPKRSGKRFQRRSVESVNLVRPQMRDVAEVEVDPVELKAHRASIRLETFLPITVHDLPNLREAPAQRAVRVVGDLPEQLAEALAALGTASNR